MRIAFAACLLLGSLGVLRAQTETAALDFLDADRVTPHRLALEAFGRKDYRKAARHFLELLRLTPDSAPVAYQLGTCYAQLGEPLLAAKALERALDAGLKDLDHVLKDPLLVPVRLDPNILGILRRVKALKEARGETLLVEAQAAQPVRIRLPKGHDSAKAVPLVVLLHGNGGNPESMMGVPWDQAIVVAPRGAYLRPRSPLDRMEGYSWFYQTQDRKLWERLDPDAVEHLQNVIQAVRGRHAVSGTYLLGHSQGGALAYLAGLTHTAALQGILVFGAADPREVAEASRLAAAKALPVFIAHGRQDRMVPFPGAEQARDHLLGLGYSVRFEAWDGGHELSAAALRKAWAWILEQEARRGKAGKP